MRIILLLLIVVVGVSFIYLDKNDSDTQDGKSKLVEGISNIRSMFDSSKLGNTATTIYKTQDKDGNWVFSNEPPKSDNPTEELKIYSDANIIPSIRKKEAQEKK